MRLGSRSGQFRLAIVAAACACLLLTARGPASGQMLHPARPDVPSAAPANSAIVPLAPYTAQMARVQSDCSDAAESGGAAGDAARAEADLAPLLHAAVLVPGAHPSLVYADNRPLMGLMQSAGLAQPAANETADDVRSDRWAAIAGDIAQGRADLPARAAPAPAGNARTLAVKVLAGSDFASDPIPPKSIWERMGDALARWLSRIHLHPGPGSGPVVAPSPVLPEIILIVICLAAVGLIARFTAIWLRERSERRSRDRQVGELDLAFTLEEKELVAAHDYARLRALADEAAAAGDLRSGYRLVFLATLVYLDAEGAIRLDRALTNWEYLRSLAGASGLPELLRPVVCEFDRIWYGRHAAQQREFDLAADAYAAIQARVERERAAALAAGGSGAEARAGAGVR